MPCYKPISLPVAGQPEAKMLVGCGRCIGCRLERSRQWAIRCVHEAQMHQENCFVTFTYRDDELIHGKTQPTLYPRHLELFWKKLRKYYAPRTIRYFACGEYGDKYNRPHYHACIFGLDFADKKKDSAKNGNDYYRSDILDSLWGHGRCIIGAVSLDSAAYVARYIMKKRLGETSKYYEELGIEPEFSRVSRRPGIGADYYSKYSSDLFPSDTCIINYKQLKPPKYYLNKLKLKNPTQYDAIKTLRKTGMSKNPTENFSSRLAEKLAVKKAQIKTLTRELQ